MFADNDEVQTARNLSPDVRHALSHKGFIGATSTFRAECGRVKAFEISSSEEHYRFIAFRLTKFAKVTITAHCESKPPLAIIVELADHGTGWQVYGFDLPWTA
jgi:hypothetical protein